MNGHLVQQLKTVRSDDISAKWTWHSEDGRLYLRRKTNKFWGGSTYAYDVCRIQEKNTKIASVAILSKSCCCTMTVCTIGK
eukprot:4123385-Amphidinium_carterae.1